MRRSLAAVSLVVLGSLALGMAGFDWLDACLNSAMLLGGMAMAVSMPPRRSAPATVPRLLSLRQIAEQTTIPRSTWYTIVGRGEIPIVRVGRSVRVDEQDLVAWIAAHRERTA